MRKHLETPAVAAVSRKQGQRTDVMGMSRNGLRLGSKGIRVAAGAAITVLAAGCSRAPTFNILGSFFPSWILCGLIGILLAGAVRVYFDRIRFEQYLLPLIIVYPCLAAFFTFTLWLLFFA